MLAENAADPDSRKGASQHAGDGARKRRRSDGPEGSFDDLLGQAGCELSSSREGCQYEAEDPRKLRRLLERKLTLNAELRAGFLAGLQEQLAEAPALHAALKPMHVTKDVPITGDSFVRILLNVAPLQAPVSHYLLERLPEFCGAEGDEAPLPALILGQFRWLDHVADAQQLTEKLLEVLPVCPEEVKKDAITFLPEVATEEDHEAVIGVLEGMMGDSQYILPCIEALANLCLTRDQQASDRHQMSRVVEAVKLRFGTADAEDLPAVARFLLQYSAPGSELKEVVGMLRRDLHFKSATDPRLGAPDRKQKGRVLSGNENPEHRLLEALKQAMQLSPAAANAFVKEIKAANEPEAQRILDLWVLLVMLTLGAERRKAAGDILRKKFAAGEADATWLQAAIAGHERVMLEFFPQLLGLAQQLLRNGALPVRQAGMELFCCLFLRFTDAYNQQEVLRALHAHLGAQVAAETSGALEVLLRLSRQHCDSLGRYAAFLTNVLDYIHDYSDQQVSQVFSIFGELVAGSCRRADEAGSSGDAGGRSRMEDELMIFVRKQLSSAQGQHRRIGIIGTVALVQRLGVAVSGAQESESAIGRRCKEAMDALKDTIDSCRRSPEAFAFLCDELTRGIQRKAIGRRLMADVHAKLSSHLEDNFFCFLEGAKLEPADDGAQFGVNRLESELWWNLDGAASPVALRLLPLLAEELAPGSNSAPLLALFSTLRLASSLELELNGELEALAALLGCPFNLFDQAMADPQKFGGMPAEQRRAVLLGLWYALNWCRELTNSFAGLLKPSGQGDDSIQLKLFGRLRCCCQLEALLDVLLQHAPPLFVLPPLGNTLESSPASLAAAAAAAAPKKASAKGGAKSGMRGSKRKAVQFKEDDSSGGGGGGVGGADSQHTTSGAGSALQANSGCITQQAGGAGMEAAASGGLQLMAAERWKQRSLLLPALASLGVGAAAGQEHCCYAMLPSAAYVLADLSGKLKTALAGTKRAFPGKASRPQLPADLGELPADQLLAAVAPVLYAVRRHLDAAVLLFEEGLQDEGAEEHDRTHFWEALAATGATQLSPCGSSELKPGETAAACLACSMDGSVAAAALSPCAAAARVRTLALDCVRQLVQWPGLAEPANRPLLHALLAAFHQDPQTAAAAQAETLDSAAEPGAGQGAEGDLVPLIRTAFVYFASPLPELAAVEPTTESPTNQHAYLLILDGLRALLARLDAAPTERSLKSRSKMSLRISKAAEALLTQVTLDSNGRDLGSAAWKGHGPMLADVLRLYLSNVGARKHGGDLGTVQAVLQLATTCLPLVPESTKAKDAAECVDPYPALSGSSVSVWYRVCLEQLQAAWEEVTASAVGAEKHKATLQDDEALQAIVAGMQSCADAFAALLAVVKGQPHRVAIHVQAVKSGGKYLLTFFKTLPFWSHLFATRSSDFQAVVTQIQKGTRVLQTLCSEGKCNKNMPLTARVPAVKRTVEKFVFLIRAFFTEADARHAFWLGALKHRDLSGRQMPSQMYQEDEGDEAEVEEEDEEEEYGDEETGETQAGDD